MSGDRTHDVAIVGAGVVGTAIARQLARYRLRTVVLERSNDVGTGTSKANTAILHTGFDTRPGSLESMLVRRGHELLGAYAVSAGIALEHTGAVLVAWDAEQGARLDAVVATARANGYERAERITLEELYRREPNLGGAAAGAVSIPDECVICPWSPSIAFATEAVGAGVELRLGVEVTDAERDDEVWLLRTTGEPVRAAWVVNAAGLGADHLDRRFGHDAFTITPRRGQLIVFDKLAATAAVLHPPPGADRADEGRARRSDRLRQRAAGPHGRGPRRPGGHGDDGGGPRRALMAAGRRIVPDLVRRGGDGGLRRAAGRDRAPRLPDLGARA